LTGGVDVNSSLYDGATAYDHKPDLFQDDRDLFERKIFEYSQKHNLPLLGICRGLQLVNVLQGGKLTEDIGVSNATHRKENDIDKEHAVHAESNSLLQEITGSAKGEVNSAHHQAVRPDGIGENLKVNAWSENDSMVEGLEYNDKTGKAFMLCVQWHPERLKGKENNPFSQRIKERFLQEVKKATTK
jgi:putative glutamine amidotransferase